MKNKIVEQINNDVGMKFAVYEKAVKLINPDSNFSNLNVREIIGNRLVLENDEFVIEIKYKEDRK